MKIELDIDIPEGYEATGEYRCPVAEPCIEAGEFYAEANFRTLKSIILRRKKRKTIKFIEVASFADATKTDTGSAYGTWIKDNGAINLWLHGASEVQWYRREETEE